LPGRIASQAHRGFRPNAPGPNVTKEMIHYNFLSYGASRPKESPVGAFARQGFFHHSMPIYTRLERARVQPTFT
jgi:hypothetical protein